MATRLVELHPHVSSVQLLHFRSPFSRDCEELRQLVKTEWPRATFRTQSVKKDYQNLIALTEDGEFSQMGSCRNCRSLLLSKAARYMERIGAEFVVSGGISGEHECPALDSLAIDATESLDGRVLYPLLIERPLRLPRDLGAWADVRRHTREPSTIENHVRRLADKLGLVLTDPVGSGRRCRLKTPGFGERVASLFKEDVVTLNALCLLDFPLYIKADPDLQIVVAFDENEKRELQNYFLPQDLRLYPATPHGPMTLLRTNWDSKDRSEQSRIIEFVARLTATYACVSDVDTVPIYFRREFEDEQQLLNVEPFGSIEEIEQRSDLELIPLELPVQAGSGA